MRFADRLKKLERTESLKRRFSPIERWMQALNETACRLTGKEWRVVQGDSAAMSWVMDDLQDSFFVKLSVPDLEILMEELGRIAFGGDTAAMEAARQELIRELVP
jgi:hypothetical protein